MSLVINHSSLTWWGVGTQYATNQEYSDDDGCNADLILDDANPIIEKLAPVSEENDLSMQSIANLEAWLLQEDIDPGYVFEETEGDIDPANYYALGGTDKINALQHSSKHNTYYVIAICVLCCLGTNTSSYVKTNGKIDDLVVALENKYPQFIRIYHAPDGTTYLQKDVIEFIRDWVWGQADAYDIDIKQVIADSSLMKYNIKNIYDLPIYTNVTDGGGHSFSPGVYAFLTGGGDAYIFWPEPFYHYDNPGQSGHYYEIDTSSLITISGKDLAVYYSQCYPLYNHRHSTWKSILEYLPESYNDLGGRDDIRNMYICWQYLHGPFGGQGWKTIIDYFHENYGDFYLQQDKSVYPQLTDSYEYMKLKTNYPEWKNALLETESDEDSGCYYPVWIPSFSARDSANRIIQGKYYHNSLEVKLCGANIPQKTAQSGTGTNKQYNKYIIDHLGEGGIPPESED